MPFTRRVLDELMKDYQKPEDLLGENGLLKQLMKALVERALSGELTHHLGYKKEAIYPKPRLSEAGTGHQIYPCLLRGSNSR